jgi:hypothetical protein
VHFRSSFEVKLWNYLLAIRLNFKLPTRVIEQSRQSQSTWRANQSVPNLRKDSKSGAFPIEILGMILADSCEKEGKQRGCIRSAYSYDFLHQLCPSPRVLE